MQKPMIDETKLPEVKQIICEADSIMSKLYCNENEDLRKDLEQLQIRLRNLTGDQQLQIKEYWHYDEAVSLDTAARSALMCPPQKEDLTDEQIKAFRLVDNKVGELAQWDVDLLPLELADIAQDLSVFGFESISEEEFGEEFTLDSGEKKPYQQISLTLHDKQAELIMACIDYVHTHEEVRETFGNENRKGNGVYEVVRQWAEQKKLV